MAPVTFTQGTHGGGTSSATLTVIATTGAGDALVLTFGLTGSAPPTISTITDTKSNTWVSSNSVGTNPALYVWRATGATAALVSGTDTLTVTFSGNTPAGWAHSGIDAPGVSVVDVNAANSAGSGTNASVSGTPAQSGETALAFFTWSNTGGAGTMNSPFTQLDQQHPTSSAFLTTAYDLNPASGVSLTASDTIVSTAWRANLLTLEAPAAQGKVTAQRSQGRQKAAPGQARTARARPAAPLAVQARSRGQASARPGLARAVAARPAPAVPGRVRIRAVTGFAQPGRVTVVRSTGAGVVIRPLVAVPVVTRDDKPQLKKILLLLE